MKLYQNKHRNASMEQDTTLNEDIKERAFHDLAAGYLAEAQEFADEFVKQMDEEGPLAQAFYACDWQTYDLLIAEEMRKFRKAYW